LFSWLFARSKKGQFILRIEDTDLQRSKKEYEQEIVESLSWLGLDWDELYRQSERFGLYKEYADKLISSGQAYIKDGAMFLKYAFEKIQIDDLVHGPILFEELPKEEEVIIKSDGTPTYNFSCVVDDALLNITHIVRGDDHISNTPKQILIYKALGLSVPHFAHIPLILCEDGSRMSKRFGAVSIREYRQKGYISKALMNYLLLLGWSPGGNREIITLDEAKKFFSLSAVNKTAACFSFKKLDWLNAEYLKRFPDDEYLQLLIPFWKERLPVGETADEDYLKKVALLYKTRLTTLESFIERAGSFFKEDFVYQPDAQEILKTDASAQVKFLKETLLSCDFSDKTIIEQEFRKVAEKLGIKAGDLVHPVRVALTGMKVGPGLFETMEVLGKERVIRRLDRLLSHYGARKAE
jgi:glutamyl-tRNA synthetase